MQLATQYFDVSVFIGRFQPIHVGHLKTIRLALERSKICILIVGSYKSAPSTRNPWSSEQRIEMIKKCLHKEERKRVFFLPIRDRIYSEIVWQQNIVNEIFKVVQPQASIALIGHNKDATSYYLKNFPNWTFIETGNFDGMNSTDFRKKFFSCGTPTYHYIPEQIKTWLQKFRKSNLFNQLLGEYLFVEEARKKLSQNSFSVANSLVLCGNYILLVRRKNYPGKYLYAMPGGHLEENEEPMAGALRELYEETNIELKQDELKSCFVKKGYYDYTERNPIARTFAHVFFYKLHFVECPKVTAGDDAHEAHWILLDELNSLEDKFFADHYQIIQVLLGRISE
ncbi:MAG: NUDIX domain-containing protein [Bdellovibrionota bacterium]